ncbi:O-antigen ligase family protein [Guggenheimella bovis]
MTEKKNIDFNNKMLFMYLMVLPLLMFPDGHSFNVALTKFIALAVLSLVFFLHAFTSSSLEGFSQPEDKMLGLYFLWLTFTAFFASDIEYAFIGSNARHDGILSMAFYMIAYFVAKSSRITMKFLKGVIVSSILICIYGVLQFYHLDPPFLHLYPDSWIGLTFSTMGNPNFLGSYLVLVLPISLYVALKERKPVYFIPFAFILFTLLCTRTRGAWIGFGVSMIVLFSLSLRVFPKKRVIIYGLIALLITGAVFVGFDRTSNGVLTKRVTIAKVDVKKVVTDPEHAKTAGTNRVYLWKKCIELIKEKPLLGYGVENMSDAMYTRYKAQIEKDFGKYLNWDKAHNEYLNILVSGGIPALILYLGFIILVLMKAFKRLKDCPMIVLFLSGIFGYLVQAIFSIQMVSVYYVFMCYLGLSTSRFICPENVDSIGVSVEYEQ